MTFAYKYRFLLLLLPAALVGVYFVYHSWKQARMAEHGDGGLFSSMAQSHSGRQGVAAFVMAIVALALVVVALVGPQWGEKPQRIERRGIDVVFALDISRSMLAEDVPPSRLAAAKGEIDRILSLLGGDRVGLVAFAGIAFTQSPLTSDYHAIRRFIRNLDPADMPVQGTAVGRAIREATRLLEGRREDSKSEDDDTLEMSRGHDQLIVLFTDGEDHDTLPIQAAEGARESGIRVITVAMGTETGAEIPDYGPDGTRRGSLRLRGEAVVSRMDPQGLIDVANAGGGVSIVYAGEGSVANVVAAEIDRLEDAELETILSPEREDRFYFFVAPAIVLLLVGFALTDRRRKAPHIGWISALALSTMIGLPHLGCSDTFVYESDQVEEGLERSREGEHEEGLDQIRGFRDEIAPEDLIDEESIDYNEGVLLLRSAQLEQAQSRFLAALGSQDEEVVFRSRFNLGNLAFDEGRWADAQHRYVQALQIRPDDEDAKWNLEVTLRRIYPPCFTLEDDMEDNDTPQSAANWVASEMTVPGAVPAADPDDEEEEEEPKAVLCGGDADWYIIPEVVEGSHVTVELTFDRLREDTGGAELPDRIPEDSVTVSVYSGNGGLLMGQDTGEGSGDGQGQVDATHLERGLVHIPVVGDSAPQGVLFLEVTADLGLEFEYDLEISIVPPCGVLEDPLEDNDHRSSASTLEQGPQQLQICVGDDDWFSFFAFAGDSVFVDVEPGPSTTVHPGQPAPQPGQQGSIALRAELYRRGEAAPLQVSEGRDGLLELSLIEMTESGEFDVRIAAAAPDEEGPYIVTFYRFPPCIAGEDQFEENDDVRTAAAVDPTQQAYRHLRICLEDPDWFSVPVQEGEHISVAVEFEEPDRAMTLSMTEPGSTTVIASGTASERPAPPSPPPGELGPPVPRARQLRQLHLEEPEHTGDYGLRVVGEPGFYNLTFPDPNHDGQCDNPQPSPSPDQESSDNEPSDGEHDPQESAEQDEPQDPQDSEQQPPEPQEQEVAEAQPSEEEQAEEQLRQLLESLSDEDVNLQLHQALQNLPPVQTERPW